MPEAAMLRLLETPEEELALNRAFIDGASKRGIEHVSLVWHTRSLGRGEKGRGGEGEKPRAGMSPVLPFFF